MFSSPCIFRKRRGFVATLSKFKDVQGNLEVTIYGVLYAFIGAGFYEQFTFRGLICEDERQFVRHTGQEWTTLKRLAANHRNRLQNEAPQLLGIGTEPEFAIG